MKRASIFKHLFVTFVFVASFFMFSKASVKAVEIAIKDNGNLDSNFSFVLEEVSVGEPTAGYVIVDVKDYCEGIDECSRLSSLKELVIPDTFTDGNPIVGIASGTAYLDNNMKAYDTALSDLSFVKIEKIVFGSNMVNIGDYAFSSLDVESVYLSNSVSSLGKYAFDGSKALNLYVNRYYPALGENAFTNIFEETFLNSSLSRIVFNNALVMSEYISGAEYYKAIESKLTYEIKYEFYEKKTVGEVKVDEKVGERIYYFNEPMSEFVELAPQVGFTFEGWVYGGSFGGGNLEIGFYPEIVESGSVSVYSSWSLDKPDLEMKTYVNGVENVEHKVPYEGSGTKIDVIVEENVEVNDYDVSYEWTRVLGAGNNFGAFGHDGSNSYSLSLAVESGTYNCFVTITAKDKYDNVYYSYEEISLYVEVSKRKLEIVVDSEETVYGTYVSNSAFGYSIKSPTSLANGDKIDKVEFSVNTADGADISSKVHEDAISVNIKNICRVDGSECDPDNVTNYVSNYDIEIVVYGDLTVTKKSMSVPLLLDNNRIKYGDIEYMSALKIDTVYGDINKSLVLTYIREKINVNDVGEYKIIGVSVDNENYDVTLDSQDYKFYIDKKEASVNWDGYQNLIYNEQERVLNAHYVSNSGDEVELDYLVYKDEQPAILKNAGRYIVSIDLTSVDSNYLLSNTSRTVDIAKEDSVLSIKEGSNVFEYDGLEHTLEVELNHNEKEVVVEYVSVACKNVTNEGSPCKVRARVEASENYNAKEQIYNIYISKKNLQIVPKEFKITYGTQNIAYLLRESVLGVNGEMVDVTYSIKYVTGGMNVGFYDIDSVSLVNAYSNYTVDLLNDNVGVGKIEVVKAPIEIVFFVFEEELKYDGKTHNPGFRIDGTMENVGAIGWYDDDKVPINAGNYKYNVRITNNNFYIDGESSVEFSIAKADYDISNLKLENKNVKFNFKGHTIDLVGELPKGLTSYTYEIDGIKGSNGTSLPFSHTVKVYFEGDFENYNELAPLVATLYIDMTWVFVTLGVVLFASAIIVVGIILLVKYKVIKFKKRIRKHVFARVMKKNRLLDDINVIISQTRMEIEDSEEEVGDIEDNFKFVKTEPIKVNKEIVSMSFVDELFKAEKEIKEYYSEIKNELLSYEGVSSKIKRDYETFYLHNMPIARLDIENGTLYAFYSLDPSVYKVEEYKHENVGKKKDFATVPLKLKVNSLQSLRHAKMFVRIIRKRENIKSVSHFVRMDYARVYTAKEGSFKMFKKAFGKRRKKTQNNEASDNLED